MNVPSIDPQALLTLNRDLEQVLDQGVQAGEREKSAKRIHLILNGVCRKIGLIGEVHMFGSFSNGFKTGTSDLDVVFIGSSADNESAVSILGRVCAELADLGFENITKIFQASVPLLKLTDMKAEMEVDFCINNELGVRNSLLLNTYCKIDTRVLHLGRVVKDWAKKHELVGTADGCLNSYAYMLLVIFFLQSVQPPVVPNLQALECESVLVCDRKWGNEDSWETKFCNNFDQIPKSSNTSSIGELLVQFFHFYSRVFDWRTNAVCMRLNQAGTGIDKYSLMLNTTDEQWYIEDPFDLRHNLAGKCSRAGKARILEAMNTSLQTLSTVGTWASALPQIAISEYFMKCRISQSVTPQALLEEFEEFDLVKLHFPKPDSSARLAQAFLQFSDSNSRRRAHTKNEKYIADCQLQLHYSTQHSLAEAVNIGHSSFSTYEMASYKMQRQVLAARVQNLPMSMKSQDMSGAAGMSQQSMAMHAMQGYKDMQQDGSVAYPLYGQRPPPPPPPPMPQQQSQLGWEQMGQRMQQMHQMQHQQQKVMQHGSLQMPGAYPQQQQWPHQQQMQQQPVQVPPLIDGTRALKKTIADKEAEKQEKKQTKAEAKAAKAKAEAQAAAKQKTQPKVVAAPNKTGWPANALGWLDVTVSVNMPERTQILTKEQADKLKELQNFFKRYESHPHDRKVKTTVTVLDVEVKDDRRKAGGIKPAPLFTQEQWQIVQEIRQKLEKR
eukprot:TRINITY_DN6307_c1_g1_i1.p1 TRINITY_DN6307_c1_g1~~TRINITY_DN6307_c1_g1_i1.p1  ORF type:complete len:723 (-),score=160.44 TRINITY_DN6307_c1_g1_i1:468-2636(-)